METLQTFIEQYGYLAVFVGCFVEGETVLVLAGFAAHMGYLSLPEMIGTAAVAGFAGDQTLYSIGRQWGERLFARFPKLAAVRPRVAAFLDRYGAWAAFCIRFMIGMRLAGPIAIGIARFPRVRFAPANAAGAVAWACAFGGAGYGFGQAFTTFLERARHLELFAFVTLGMVGAAMVVVMRMRTRRHPRARP